MNGPFPHHAVLAALREENDILRETVRQLREELAPVREFPAAWKLNPQQTVVLSCLVATAPGIAKHTRIRAALYEDRDPPDCVADLIMVVASRLRHRLRAAGVNVEIQNVFGVGYRISEADRDRLIAELSSTPLPVTHPQTAGGKDA
jgi:hypothetical protein